MHTDKFDFDTLPNRNDMGCAKWDRRTPAQREANAVPLTIADMDFLCAPCVMEAVEKAARHGVYGYTDADAPYYEAVVGWMARRHDWAIEPEWVVPQNGIVPAMSVAVRVFTEPGDGVLIQTPRYGPFAMSVEMNGRVPVYTRLCLGEDGYYRMDWEDMERKAADPRVKLFMLCSPHNPSGRIWTPEELREMARICREHDIAVVSDEIHFDLELDGTHTVFLKAAPEMTSRAIVLTAPSKTFNTAGLQLSNVIIPDADIRARYRARAHADGYSNVSYFGYHATLAAYRHGDAWLDALLAYVRGNFAFLAEWLAEHLPKVRLLPAQGTYLAWTDWQAFGLSGEALQTFLREEALVAANPGAMFGEGGEGHYRLNLAVPRAALARELDRILAAAKRRGLA